MEISFYDDDLAFRDEVREFLTEACTEEPLNYDGPSCAILLSFAV